MAYNAFVLHVLYCLPAWGNASQDVSSQMGTMLKKCTCIITDERKTVFSKKFIYLLDIFNFNDTVFMSNARVLFLFLKSTEYKKFNVKCTDHSLGHHRF